MTYPLQNALFQWDEGRRRVQAADPERRRPLERATQEVVEELRRRLGGGFLVRELAELYAGDPPWAERVAADAGAGVSSAWVVDAAFGAYAREASDFAGGRPHERPVRD